MKKLAKGEIIILPRTKWTIDVFTGKGWENHSCFHVYKGHLKLVGGQPVTDREYSELTELLK
jgi:hypothetical protein